ncbi:MAG: 4-hydroxythreonine-4-phosphate dehydrogenase PdxA [Betaproteobacteria bacterium]
MTSPSLHRDTDAIDSNHSRRPIALTVGEPAGIGPDLCVLLARQGVAAPLVVIGDAELLQARARLRGVSLSTIAYVPGEAVQPRSDCLYVMHRPLAVQCEPGRLDARNARAVLDWLRVAAQGCMDRSFAAMVTAPVHKGIINDAGVPFSGHTEFLAALTHTDTVVMMLVGAGMRVALATTHLPLRAVADAITPAGLEATLRVLHRDLVKRFGLAQPTILVAGLNPHAGESGHLGDEEIRIIEPVLRQLRRSGMDLRGPLPADTLFNPSILKQADCVLAMYHDQGLPVLKYASFGAGVNITLGLPIVRTSVDHGTALDRARTGEIEFGSLIAAIELAAQLAYAEPPQSSADALAQDRT